MSDSHRWLIRRIMLAAFFISPLVAACGINLQSCNCLPPPFTPVNVTTQHNDNFRSGQNLHETILTPFAVQSGRFGRLFARYVDGQPYAQPLYVHDLDFGNGQKHNVVLSATEANNVYAFDADNPELRQPYWQSNFGAPYHVDNCDNLQPSVGITSTPVIDIDSRTMYGVAATAGGGPTCPNVQHNLSHPSVFG